ncbi:O-antigen ligase family protein [Amaricoccus sp.]|uniref:O-antigen ligase family protein n=1 Tax=Amaricoccus sp. TaxID=1872485 RepID=UPI0026103015|nr:O-antigen ligase family protein [Amaricoccus sp.]HRO11896.1 O-antigen ligase family protein [Amaricoccus sp.]
MSVAPIAVLVGVLLLALGQFTRAPTACAFFASLAFGSTAIVTGGINLLLYVPLAGLLMAAAVLRRTFWGDLARVFRLHWTPIVVVTLLVYGVASAFILPRLFAGETTVFVPSRGAIVETALRPVSGNINQSGYFAFGILAFFAVASQLARDGRFEMLRIGFFASAIANASLGMIDFAGKLSGAGDLLAPIRTAGYSMLIEVQVEGFWRIAGGFPEASTFGAATTVGLAFAFSYWRATNWRPALVLSVVLFLQLLLSTSSTGYASLAILGALLSLSYVWRLMLGRLNSRDLATILAGAIALTLVLAVLAFMQGALDPVQRLIEETLINKSTSASADERFYWNAKSWKAFLDTYGLGVGLGSSRASSWVIAVLSQLGAFGTFLIVLLLLEMARPIPRPRLDPEARELAALCSSLRTTALASMIPAAISSSVADPGIVFFIALAGVVVGRERLRQMQASERAALPHPRWERPTRGSAAWTGGTPATGTQSPA